MRSPDTNLVGHPVSIQQHGTNTTLLLSSHCTGAVQLLLTFSLIPHLEAAEAAAAASASSSAGVDASFVFLLSRTIVAAPVSSQAEVPVCI